MTALRSFVGVFCLLVLVSSESQLNILHSPNGINFHGSQGLKSDALPEILLAAMGHTGMTSEAWDGLTILNPFNYPAMTVVISFDGSLSMPLAEQRYPMKVTTSLKDAKKIVASSVGEVVDESDLVASPNNIVFGNLNTANKAVKDLVQELKLLKALSQKIAAKEKVEFVWLQMSGMSKVMHEFGQDSEQTQEALTQLKDVLDELETSLVKVNKDKYLLAVLTNHKSHIRRTRQANNTKETDFSKINMSKQYDENYAAIFNICLWLSVFLIAALIATAVFICTMDPGRDSIIYRMTTQRIKKEN